MSLETFRSVPCIETVSNLVQVCKRSWGYDPLQKAAKIWANQTVDTVRSSRGLRLSFAEAHGMSCVQGGTLSTVAHVSGVTVVFPLIGHVRSQRPDGSYQLSGYLRAGRISRANHAAFIMILILRTGDGVDIVRRLERCSLLH